MSSLHVDDVNDEQAMEQDVDDEEEEQEDDDDNDEEDEEEEDDDDDDDDDNDVDEDDEDDNDVETMWKPITFDEVDDQEANGIGQALLLAASEADDDVNSRRVKLKISRCLTLQGAQVVAHALKQSHVERLRLCVNLSVVKENILQPILEVAVHHIPKLRCPLNNNVAEKLSAILLSLNNDGVDDGADNNHHHHHHALRTLWLTIKRNMTVDAAQRLGNGLRRARLKCFKLEVDPSISLNVTSIICIAAIESVTKLVLCPYIKDEMAIVIGNALIDGSTIQSLQLKLNRLSVHAATQLANGINHSHIVSLNMQGDVSAEVGDTLYEGVARSSTIQHLTIGYGFSGTPAFTQCLSRLHTLEMDNFVEVEDVPALMMGLRNAPHLSSLVMGRRFQEAQDNLTICAAPSYLTSLRNLTLHCDLACEEQHDGDPLDLESLRIHPTGAEQLMVALANHPTMVCLTLHWCLDFGFTGHEMIGMHLPNIKLKELDIGTFFDKYFQSDKRVMVRKALQRACQALVIGMRSNWHLHVLTLDDRFPSETVNEINFYLDLNKSGRYLLHDTDINAHKVPMGLWSHVLAKCGNKVGFVYYYLREQPHLLPAVAGMASQKAHGPISIRAGTKRHRKE